MLVEHDRPLVDRPFEAWDYGPVEPDVYRLFKAYGSKPIVDIIWDDPYGPGDLEHDVISDVMSAAGNMPASRLVAVTHWKDGAWARHYIPGVRGIIIPDEDIVDEYHRRIAAVRASTAAAEQRANDSPPANA
jgi:uncharacterized phage-associated protein